MKIVVFGSTGMLGRYVTSYMKKQGYEVIPLTRKDYDILESSEEKMKEFLESMNITHKDKIVNCAGLIPQRQHTHFSDYAKANSYFPQHLGVFSKQGYWEGTWSTLVFHASTDCVFSGDKGKYKEHDRPDAIDIYGFTKSVGEHWTNTNIRTSIIGEELENKVSFLEFVRSNDGNTIDGYTNHFWNGITCLQWAKNIDDIIKNYKYWHGIKHIFSPKSYSKYELACLIRDVYDINVEIKPTQITPKKVDKTLATGYEIDIEIPDLKEQLQEMKEYKV